MKNLIKVGVIAAVAGFASSAQAAEFTYIFTGLGVGQLGDFSFDDETFTVRVTGDTANIVEIESGIFTLNAATASFEVSGLTADITTDLYVFVNQLNNEGDSAVGLSRTVGSDIYNLMNNAAFASYDLSTPFPLTIGSAVFGDFKGIQTSAGPLSLDVSSNEGTFEVIPTPGVSALALVAGVAGLRRRRA
jgi:uncharacterized protein (TIGR03382 family)